MSGQQLKSPWIRTPLVRSAALSRAAGCNIYLKLENLQPSGSFKSRGIGNFLLSRLFTLSAPATNNTGKDDGSATEIHFYSSSGGNAGLGCVHAAVTLGSPATIVVPLSTTDSMISKLRVAGAADVIQHGKSWAEADRFLVEDVLPKARKRGEHAIYVPPFDAQEIWDGNAGIVHEVFEQLREVDSHYYAGSHPTTSDGLRPNDDEHAQNTNLDALVCSVGGGGLFCGLMQGLEDVGAASCTRVLAVETVGADSLSQAVSKGELVTLPEITSIATSLGARTVCQQALEYGMRDEVTTMVLTDAEAVDACLKFADEERVLVEPACGVCVALCYDGRLKKLVPGLNKESRIVIVVCGGSNISLATMQKYVQQYHETMNGESTKRDSS